MERKLINYSHVDGGICIITYNELDTVLNHYYPPPIFKAYILKLYLF
jgi:hypothetical protein